MPSKLSDQQYGQALLDSIQQGRYPDSEELISSDLPSTAVPGIGKLLKQAQEDVKVEIRETSREIAQDIDGWILQAKHLRDDVQESLRTAQQIVARNAEGHDLRTQTQDAASKRELLVEEVEFTETIIAVYQHVGALRRRLDSVQDHLQRERLSEAATGVVKAEAEVESLQIGPNIRAVAVLRDRLSSLRKDVTAVLLDCWRSLVTIVPTPPTFNVAQGTTPIPLELLVETLYHMDVLDGLTRYLCKDIDSTIIVPLLQPRLGENAGFLTVDGSSLTLRRATEVKTIDDLFADISKMIEFLSASLPDLMASMIPKHLGSALISRLISVWLSSVIPTEVAGIADLQHIVESVSRFAEVLEDYKWPGKARLRQWTQETPHLWLSKRQERTLDRVRRMLASGVGNVETVERTETQLLSKKGDIVGVDDWNAEWSDEEEADRSAAKHHTIATEENVEDDVSAWGLGDDVNGGDQDVKPEKAQDENEDAEAWGWGDEEEGGETNVAPEPPPASRRQSKSNGIVDSAHGAKREVTLKETYNITSLPRDVLEIITQTISDAENLSEARPVTPMLDMEPAAIGLFALPGLVLTIYRASAPSYYALHPSGNMFLYNDCVWLSERLQEHTHDHPESRGNLRGNITALSAFGKRAYGKEMESQRTILSDLLDGAQGFSNCTAAPFAQECDLAIGSAVDHLREKYRQWQPVLSHSALLQSVGSLLSTVVNKIIVDIEDMSDISEPESQRLTALCTRVTLLEDIFLPPRSAEAHETEQANMPLAALHTPGWLKFQYLVNILESSLVDIKFLWEEGELGLEFEAGEVVDLIEALFADSEHRRRAIGDIRRASGHS